DMIVDVDDVIGSPFLPPDGIARLPHGDAAPPHRRNADFTPIGPEHAPLTTLPGRPARALKARSVVLGLPRLEDQRKDIRRHRMDGAQGRVESRSWTSRSA